MNIIVLKEDIQRALSLINGIVEKKANMPIMANVLISVEDNIVKFSGSDVEIAAQVIVQAKVKERGSTTVSAKMLLEIVRELPEGDVELKLNEGERLEITAKNSKLRIGGVSAQEYPSLPGLSLKADGKIQATQLLEMIQSTLYAVSTDETRFNLSGVCFESVISDQKDGIKIVRGKKANPNCLLKLVSTDGHRLALITRIAENISFVGRVIAPRKGLQELRHCLEQSSNQEISIGITEGFIVAETSDTKIAMRLIDGEFPDYTRAIPINEGTQIVLSSKELSQSLKRVALLVTDKQKSVKFDLSEGNLKISSSSPELGDAAEIIQVDYNGAPITVGFNAKYVREIMDVIGEDQKVIMELHGEAGPGKFFVQGDDSSFGVVMPMRIV